MTRLYPVILSGGAGTRLWPLSRSLYPKQLLALTGEDTLLQQTAQRTVGADVQPPLIVCNQEHRFLIAEQMRAAGMAPLAIVLEPLARNTAPAAAAAALMVAQRDPDGLMLLLPADHVVRDTRAYADAIATARPAAQNGHLVTFGITPSKPETGYGYIQRGEPLGDGVFAIARFVEKPDAKTAAAYLAAGDHDWNSGMFLMRARDLVAEFERLEPQMLADVRASVEKGRQDLDFFRLDAEAFGRARSVSIDYAVMERTARAAIVPVEMGWSDVGSWEALWDCGDKDASGNVVRGDVIASGATGSLLRSEGPLVAAVGVEDLVVVATPDAVLVSRRAASQDVKRVVEELHKAGRDLHLSHRKVHRPWGSYESIAQGSQFQVKHIVVKPGASLSLQLHHRRAEHWVVVSGTAKVTRGDDLLTLKPNESVYIPQGAKHRLENAALEALHLIEVQCGDYLGEDDIVRFEDNYGR